MTYPAPHRPFAPAIISADFKTYPADFIVKELMDVDFSGQGEHLWVHVCKVGMNTAFVAKLLANWANISIRDVGYSGLKDRHAQTYQWFSLRLPKRGLPTTDFDEFIKEYLKEGECLTLIAHHWHDKKLHRGTHKANAFTITLRQARYPPSMHSLLMLGRWVYQIMLANNALGMMVIISIKPKSFLKKYVHLANLINPSKKTWTSTAYMCHPPEA